MPNFIKWQLTMLTNSRSIILLGLLFATVGRPPSNQGSLPPGAKFEIVSVKLLTPSEAARRSPDSIGPDLAVRLRLSCGDSGFYFYTWGNGVAPVGYNVKFKEGRTVWLNKVPGHSEQGTSPGIDKLNSFVPGVWRLMSGYEHAAVEWEVLDSTSFKGEKHAFTVFIKLKEDGTPVEVISDPYVVPSEASDK